MKSRVIRMEKIQEIYGEYCKNNRSVTLTIESIEYSIFEYRLKSHINKLNNF